MQIVPQDDNMHEISMTIFKKNISNSFAECFTQLAKL